MKKFEEGDRVKCIKGTLMATRGEEYRVLDTQKRGNLETGSTWQLIKIRASGQKVWVGAKRFERLMPNHLVKGTFMHRMLKDIVSATEHEVDVDFSSDRSGRGIYINKVDLKDRTGYILGIYFSEDQEAITDVRVWEERIELHVGEQTRIL
jgi:hypothetical protein